MTLNDVIEDVLTQANAYQFSGQTRPDWLDKKMAGLYLSETEPVRGLALLADGLQDERDALDKAKYKPYRGAKL